MTVAHLILVAVTLAAEPSAPTEALAQLPPATLDDLQELTTQALPRAPSKVVRETRYYGTITIDHRAHLARRAACKTCHGTGAITKLTFTPKVAHERCVGCHEQQAKGPTKCAGCHVKTAPKPEVQVAAAAEAALPAEAAPAGPNPANLAAALAAREAPRDGSAGGVLGKEPFHRWLEVGLAAGPKGQGISVRVASHQNFIVVTQSVERTMSSSEARTFGMLGAGISHPIHSRVGFEVVGLAGLDAVDRPLLAMLPAIGARAGLEWRPNVRFFRQVTASITGVHDLSTRRSIDGDVGGTTIYGTVATGFTFPPK